MKINCIEGSASGAPKKIKEILKIYNNHYGLNETFTNEYPDKCVVVSIEGIKGGLIVESVFKGVAIIYYAGLEKKGRRKGYLRQCINYINEHTDFKIVGVQVNSFDDFGVWNHLGFVHLGILNFTVTLLNVTTQAFKEMSETLPNNEEF